MGKSLTEQEFLLQQKLLEQQLLKDFLVVCWVEVVDGVSDDGFIDWDGSNVDDGQEDEQCLRKRKRNVISSLVPDH